MEDKVQKPSQSEFVVIHARRPRKQMKPMDPEKAAVVLSLAEKLKPLMLNDFKRRRETSDNED